MNINDAPVMLEQFFAEKSDVCYNLIRYTFIRTFVTHKKICKC